MKFCNRSSFEGNLLKSNMTNKFYLILMLIIISYVGTNKLVNFKNSLYLLDFKYYHTTEVII